MRVDVYVHLVQEKPDHTLEVLLNKILKQGEALMADSKQVLAKVQEALQAVQAIGPAVDSLEAKVTELVAKIGTVPPEVQADLDAAFDALSGVVAAAGVVAADASDGVDEAVVTV